MNVHVSRRANLPAANPIPMYYPGIGPISPDRLDYANNNPPQVFRQAGRIHVVMSDLSFVAVSSAIELLISWLDCLAPDADLEPDVDREPENEHGGDILDEPHDGEDDDEPWLGWAEGRRDQTLPIVHAGPHDTDREYDDAEDYMFRGSSLRGMPAYRNRVDVLTDVVRARS